jgi:hypothetical protein
VLVQVECVANREPELVRVRCPGEVAGQDRQRDTEGLQERDAALRCGRWPRVADELLGVPVAGDVAFAAGERL